MAAEAGKPFVWADGDKLDDDDYTMWGTGEPAIVEGVTNCATIYTGKYGHTLWCTGGRGIEEGVTNCATIYTGKCSHSNFN